MKLDAWKQPFFNDKMLACSMRGHWVSFCLVDEAGSGKAYGGLSFTAYDSTGCQYEGRLDGEGFAKLQDFYCGPVILLLDERYSGTEEPYARLSKRLT